MVVFATLICRADRIETTRREVVARGGDPLTELFAAAPGTDAGVFAGSQRTPAQDEEQASAIVGSATASLLHPWEGGSRVVGLCSRLRSANL